MYAPARCPRCASTFTWRVPPASLGQLGALFQASIDFILRTLPLVCIVENSDRIAKYQKGAFVDSVVRDLEAAGYTVHKVIVNACDCGLPQYRKRLYIVGIHRDAGDIAIGQPSRARVKVDSLLAPRRDSDNPDLRPTAKGAKYAVDNAIAMMLEACPEATLNGFVAVRHSKKWVDKGKVVVRTVIPALTHSTTQPPWVLQRGRPLLASEAARLQGVLGNRLRWPNQPASFKLLGNSMAGSVLHDLMADAMRGIAPNAVMNRWWDHPEVAFEADAAMDAGTTWHSLPPLPRARQRAKAAVPACVTRAINLMAEGASSADAPPVPATTTSAQPAAILAQTEQQIPGAQIFTNSRVSDSKPVCFRTMGRGKCKRDPSPSLEAKKRIRRCAKIAEASDEQVGSSDDEMTGGADHAPLKAAAPLELPPSGNNGSDEDGEDSDEDSEKTAEEDDAVICQECVKPILVTDKCYKHQKMHIECGRKKQAPPLGFLF